MKVIRDRGAKKWETSFMLPEHNAMLHDLWEEQKRVEKPILDEQAFEQIGIIIMDSLKHTIEIKITYWENWRIEEVIGIVGKVDMQIKQIRMNLDNDEIRYIMLDSITAAERM